MATPSPHDSDGPSPSGGQYRATTQPRPPAKNARPSPWEFVLHPLKTLRFVLALARDPRISPLGKVLYLLVIGLLLVSLLVPEGLVAALIAALLPFVGPLIALPADAAVDWLLLGAMAYALLSLFPAHIVREHHTRIFHPRRR